MQQYGKITDGKLTVFDGTSVRVNGRVYVNPTEDTLKELGYKPVVEAVMPEEREGYYIVGSYTEGRKYIHRKWEYVEIPAEEAEESEI